MFLHGVLCQAIKKSHFNPLSRSCVKEVHLKKFQFKIRRDNGKNVLMSAASMSLYKHILSVISKINGKENACLKELKENADL